MRAYQILMIAALAIVPSASPAFQTPAVPSKQSPATQADVFCGWLNGQRAARGLRAVRVNPALNYTAYANNLQQTRRGLGHFYRNGDRRQNVGGRGAEYAVWQLWIASPPHSSALFDPSVTRIGYDSRGGYTTYCGS